ncbi:MAG TPA: hypothetical protein VHT24_06585, partial [Pseudacidobacterium sp.]|nr:hypothetical protein [Pseudacidobacterium sp.]
KEHSGLKDPACGRVFLFHGLFWGCCSARVDDSVSGKFRELPIFLRRFFIKAATAFASTRQTP